MTITVTYHDEPLIVSGTFCRGDDVEPDQFFVSSAERDGVDVTHLIDIDEVADLALAAHLDSEAHA